jgi:hypothetical protein
MSATINLVGPAEDPGAPQLTAPAVNAAFAAQPRYGNTGLLIPYYFYTNNPYTDPVFQSLIALIRQYHDVPVIVVLNQPGSTGLGGPGPSDGNIAAAIRLLQGAGATVIGYVFTSFGTRAQADIEADIALWGSLYSPTVDGIFFDEMPYALGTGGTDTSFVTLFQNLYIYAKGQGFSPVVCNPGSDQQPAWYATKLADIIIINENTTWPSLATVQGAFAGGHGDYDYRVNGILVYDQSSFGAATFATMQPYVQWVYVAAATLPNPWGSLSPFLAQMFNACQLSSTGGFAPLASPTFTGAVTAGATNVGALTATGITASPISGSTGSFTTLSASSTVSGAGFTAWAASPPAIGGTVPNSLKCTTFGANSVTPSGKVVITGSRGSATAAVLESLLQAMQTFGLITDSTTT